MPGKVKPEFVQARSHAGSGEALPSRAEVLAYIAREREGLGEKGKGKIGKREIARAFNLKGPARIALKGMLKDLEAEGAIARSRRSLHKPGLLPGVVVADVAGPDRDGDLLAWPAEWEMEQGPVPSILVVSKAKQRLEGSAPGPGDRALLRVEPVPCAGPGKPAYTGRVVKLLPRAKAQVLGIFRADAHGGGGRIVPVDKKNINRGEFLIAPGDQGAASDGDLVASDVLRTGQLGRPAAKVRERLGAIDNEKAISLIAIHAHQIPHVFGQEVIAEAERASPAAKGEREDWRAIPLVTIDPEDAKDHDDAVHAERDQDPANPGGFIVRVAIADVAAYVRPRSALDREAEERGNSVYFPDGVVPMLPERISNDLCSLRPNEDRPALAARIVIAADGHKLSQSFHRVMVRSAAKLSYAQVQAAFDNAAQAVPLHTPVLVPLYEAYRALKIAREKRRPLDLDLPERRIVLDPLGRVKSVVIPPRLDALRLIEEFMILANVAAAETLEAKNQAFVYRVHDEPSLEKLNNLAEFLASIGIKLAKGQVLRAAQFNRILARVKGTDNEHIVNEVVLRSQAQAEYSADNYGHFGLNLRLYTHFTSPIRRYADLIGHRALISALRLGSDGLPLVSSKELAEIAAKISAAERRAMAAERETSERLIAAHLAGQAGAEFKGRISGATCAGLFVRLDETGADGFIPAATLGDAYFRHDPARHALIGSRTGQIRRLGDMVTVRLVEAAPLAGALRFELVSETAPRRAGPKSAKSKHAARKQADFGSQHTRLSTRKAAKR